MTNELVVGLASGSRYSPMRIGSALTYLLRRPYGCFTHAWNHRIIMCRRARRRAASLTETKASAKTSEFYAFVAVVVGILVAAAMIKGGDTGGTDEFIARQAWLYVSIVTAGYMISRGLAKAGSRDPYTVDSPER